MAENDIRDTVRADDHPGDGVSRGTARMEAFADAVFAIAFTLPVIEIPFEYHAGPLWPQLDALWPSYVGVVLAATIIGTYWAHHHFAGAIYRTTGHWFNLATVIFLAVIGIVAFPCRAFADSLADAEARGEGALLFVVSLAVVSAAWLLKWETGRASGHVDDRLDLEYVRRLSRMYRSTLLVYLIGVGVALVWWPGGLFVCAVVTVRYWLPPETPVYRTEAPTVEGEP